MKRNDLAEIKKIDIKSVIERIKKAQKEIAGLVIDKNTGKLANLRTIKNRRRDIAQMMTVVKQKQLLEKLEGSENAESK